MNNSAKTARMCSPILCVTGVKYKQERIPLDTRAAQKILIVPVHFFQTGKHLSQVDINRPTKFCPSGAWTPWVVEQPGPLAHCGS
jgi:hypothetical protein